jgi:hypothetical protein
MKFFKQPKTYPYEQRMTEIARISKIPYQSVKLRALTKFEANKVSLLQSIPAQPIHSQALNSVRAKLQLIERQMQPRQQANPIARVLFADDFTNYRPS